MPYMPLSLSTISASSVADIFRGDSSISIENAVLAGADKLRPDLPRERHILARNTAPFHLFVVEPVITSTCSELIAAARSGRPTTSC